MRERLVFLAVLVLLCACCKSPSRAAGGFVTVAAGDNHAAVLRADGTVWTWGHNANGRLGDGTTDTRLAPGQVPGLSGVTALSTRSAHVVALKADGTVWTWGYNALGQLGDGTTTDRLLPVQVRGLTDVTAVAAGDEHTVALRRDGTVWVWGGNYHGTLGDGTTETRRNPVQVPGLNGVIAVSAGGNHTVVLRNDGTVWAWGHNVSGEVGDGTQSLRLTPVKVSDISGVVAISAGYYYTLALKGDGTVWAWGGNSVGQLGDGTTTYRYRPVQIPGLAGIGAVYAGETSSLAISTSGRVWAWGSNTHGQLGDGTTVSRFSPVEVIGLSDVVTAATGSQHTVAATRDGGLWAWGSNYYGRLGIGCLPAALAPAHVPGLGNVTRVAAGSFHTLAVKNDGTLWAWGENLYGKLGDGTTVNRASPVQVSGLTSVASAAGGGSHSLALRSDGTVWAWGMGAYGQLGIGSQAASKTTPVQVTGLADIAAVTCGLTYSAALKADGSVWTWGDNTQGQLGDGTTTRRLAPIQVPGLTGIASISSTMSHVVALNSDGTVWTWGYNRNGQLGDGTTKNSPIPMKVAGIDDVVAAAAGSSHTAALKRDGTVWVWGSIKLSAPSGSETLLDTSLPVQVPGLSGVVAIQASANCTTAIMPDGTLRTFGAKYMGKLGDGTLLERTSPVPIPGIDHVVSVAGGSMHHSVALKDDGTVWAWGSFQFGQVGDGRYDAYTTPLRVIGSSAVSPRGSVSIVDDDRLTNTRAVSLAIGAEGEETGLQMSFSNDGTYWSDWEPYATSRTHTLSAGDGLKVVYARFRGSSAELSAIATDLVTLDTTPPVLESATAAPEMVAGGDAIVISVFASDVNGVSAVSADGVPLTLESNQWTASLSASTFTCTHSIEITLRDAAGNETTGSGPSYRTLPVYGIGCRAAGDPIVADASENSLFKIWGRVTTAGTDAFYLADGSGKRVLVNAPGFSGITDNDYVSARGTLDQSTIPPTLTASPANIHRLHTSPTSSVARL